MSSFQSKKSGRIRSDLKPKYESEKAKVIDLRKEVNDLKLAISNSNLKIKTMGEELKASEMKLIVSNNEIKDLKNQKSIQDSLKNQMLQDIRTDKSLLESKTKQIDSQTEKIRGFQEKLSLCAAKISERDKQITELNQKNKRYISEISQLKSTHKAKEDNWKTDIGKLRTELEEKGKSVDDLNKKLDELMLKKDEVSAQLETLRADKFNQENLIQELETRLNALQAEHVGVLASFDNAQEVKNELTTKLVELKKEVDRQYMSEISQLKSTHKAKEDNWRINIGKLNNELDEKGQSVDNLNKKLDELMLEKYEVSAQLETLRADKFNQENLIQELETRLNALQTEHVGVLASFDNAQEVKNELTTKLVELKKEVDRQYMTEISQLKSTHKAKEDNQRINIGKLNKELDEKGQSVDNLNKKLDALILEKDEVSAQLETLRADKFTQENLIQELETRLNALQAEHVGVLASFDNAQEVKNELTTKVVELQKEVNMQKEVISYRTDEKMEAIRQLSSSLEYYKSRYEQLRKAFVSKNTARCFDFLY